MIKKQMTVGLSTGLQSRAAAQFVQKAPSFNSEVFVIKKEKKLAAKSIMGVMASAIQCGDEITLTANGSDEKKAVEVLEKFLLFEGKDQN